MPTYNPRISISSAPGITGYLRLALYEASAPTVIVAISDALVPPHLSSQQLQFTGLNPVIHLGKLLETATAGATTGTVLANFSLDPQFPGVEIRPDLFIYAGTTEGFDVGDNKFISPTDYLDGWDYSLEVQGHTVDPDFEYSVDSENNPTITDGTNLAGGGTYQTFEDEKWVFHFKPKLITYSPTQNTAVPFATTEVITANRTLTSADLGKNFIVSSATTTVTVTLPILADIGENRPLYFLSDGGSHINANFVTQGSDEIYYLQSRSLLILGQGEFLSIYKFNNQYRVYNDLIGVKEVGEIAPAYESGKPNRVLCNGALLSRTINARLFEYVLNDVPPDSIVSEDSWNNLQDVSGNYITKGAFTLGDGSTNFRVPLIIDFLRGTTGSRIAGNFQNQQLLNHKHEQTIGLLPTSLFGRGTVSRAKGNYNGITPSVVDLTDNPFNTLSGSENLVKNIAVYMCLKS